ncbi:MAG: hypothetical protein JW976_03700 [Syntrophaceae bacterium]|nr:hypothetical protein [Syntrophaceae bacterium]
MKKSYKIIPAILVIFLIAVYAIAGQEFVGSKTSNKYHYPTCKWVKQIKPHKIIKFRSPEEAVKAGYIPCPTCRPPLPVPDETKNNSTIESSHKKISDQSSHKSYNLNIISCSILLLLLLFAPFLAGLLEIIMEDFLSSRETGKKDSL